MEIFAFKLRTAIGGHLAKWHSSNHYFWRQTEHSVYIIDLIAAYEYA